MTGEGRFDLIVDGVLRTYRRWEDLPAVFDHVIRFEPDIPPAPHTPEQHAEAALWNSRLQRQCRRSTSVSMWQGRSGSNCSRSSQSSSTLSGTRWRRDRRVSTPKQLLICD